MMNVRLALLLPFTILLFGVHSYAQEPPADSGEQKCPTIPVEAGLTTPDPADCRPPEVLEKVNAKPASDCLYATEGQFFVLFKLLVNEKGKVTDVSLLGHFGQGDECIHNWLKALKKWRYRPYIYKGAAVSFYWTVRVNFAMQRPA